MTFPDIWYFDVNHRVHRRDANGRAYGGPIWREYWRKLNIISDTTRSWVASNGMKIPKSGADSRSFAFSLDDIERRAWVEENRHRIADSIRRLDNYEKLMAVADAVGYKEPKE